MPGEPGVTVVTTLVCFFIFACEAAGASSARHSLRPLMFWGERVMHHSGASRHGKAIGCLKTGYDTFRCHHPRKRMIQYPRGTDDQSRHRSVLDTPPSRHDTECSDAAPWIASWSLSSGAHPRDPVARNDSVKRNLAPRARRGRRRRAAKSPGEGDYRASGSLLETPPHPLA